MYRNTLVILGGLALLVTKVLTLDFSQFHLPPCCYIPPQGEAYAGYASAIVPNKVEAASREGAAELNNASSSPSTNLTAASSTNTVKLYKLIIPIESENELIPLPAHTLPKSNTNQVKLPNITVGNILFLEAGNNNSKLIKFKRGPIHENTQYEKHNSTSSHTKQLLERKETPENSQTEQRALPEKGDQIQNVSLNDVGVSLSIDEFLNTIQLLQSVNSSESDLPEEMLQEASSETTMTFNTPRKMPSVWVKNLRRALFQSLTAGRPDNFTAKLPVDQNLQTKQFWKTIRRAKLKYIDKLSESSSDLPEAVYLPTGEGPIVSGVFINSAKGTEVRITSELHVGAEEKESREDCHCSLIHQGDIVMAYWSISRIYDVNGQPALQYLVYPLPFTVPTPSELIPFSGNDLFRPSPIDPVGAFQGNRNEIPNEAPFVNQPSVNDAHNEIQNAHFYHSLPNGHHRLEINPNVADHYLPPTPIPTGQSIHATPHPHLNDYRGIAVENEQGYTPEFVNLYRAAILEHFRKKDFYQQAGPTGLPVSQYPVIPTAYPYDPDQSIQEKPPSDPTHGPPLFSSRPQSNHPHHYPNSIQDILLPINPPPLLHPLPPLEFIPQMHLHDPQRPVLSHNPSINNVPPQQTYDRRTPADRPPSANPNKVGYKDTLPPPSKHQTENKHPSSKGQPNNKFPDRGTGKPEFPPPNAERPGFDYLDRNRFEFIPYDQDPNNYGVTNKRVGVGSAYVVKQHESDQLFYHDVKRKPYTKYTPDEAKKQEISEKGYILNF